MVLFFGGGGVPSNYDRLVRAAQSVNPPRDNGHVVPLRLNHLFQLPA